MKNNIKTVLVIVSFLLITVGFPIASNRSKVIILDNIPGLSDKISDIKQKTSDVEQTIPFQWWTFSSNSHCYFRK